MKLSPYEILLHLFPVLKFRTQSQCTPRLMTSRRKWEFAAITTYTVIEFGGQPFGRAKGEQQACLISVFK